jgi:hypothetical protein
VGEGEGVAAVSGDGVGEGEALGAGLGVGSGGGAGAGVGVAGAAAVGVGPGGRRKFSTAPGVSWASAEEAPAAASSMGISAPRSVEILIIAFTMSVHPPLGGGG